MHILKITLPNGETKSLEIHKLVKVNIKNEIFGIGQMKNGQYRIMFTPGIIEDFGDFDNLTFSIMTNPENSNE